MGLSLSTVDAEQVLATLHRIAPGSRKAFLARLRDLQRFDVPKGIKPGKGHAAKYSFNGLMQTALVVELLRAGVAPRWAIAAVFSSWSELRFSILSATIPDGGSLDRKAVRDWIWAVRFEAFQEMSVAPEEAALGVWVVPARDLQRLFNDPSVGSRITVIRGSRIVEAVIEIVTEKFGFATRNQLKAEARANFDLACSPNQASVVARMPVATPRGGKTSKRL